MRTSILLASALLWMVPLAFAQNGNPLDPSFRPEIPAGGVPENVWVTDGMAKVQPNTTPGNVRFADMHAARNEFESFQIHVYGGRNRIQLGVVVSDLVNPKGGRIPGVPNVLVMSEGYLNVTTVSDLNGISGLVPDPLIPDTDPYFHERRNGFPLAIPRNETRSVWVDVFVPPKTPSGYYMATATLYDGSNILARVPLRLAVWNFDLPGTATLKSAFGMGYGSLGFAAYGDYNGTSRYPGANGNTEQALAMIHASVAAFFLDHRVTISEVLVHPTAPKGQWRNADQIYGALLNGQTRTFYAGATLTSVEYPNDPFAQSPLDIRDYVAHFRMNGWLPRLFVYACDEPPLGCSWDAAHKRIATVRAASPVIKTLITTDMAEATKNGILDGVDIMVPLVNRMHPMNGSNERDNYSNWLKDPNKELWWYQSCNQHMSCDDGKPGPKTSTWPSYMIDASPVRNRIFQWLAYMYRVQGELYYDTEHWGDKPWERLYFAGGNGDGALYYPGTPARIGGTTPIPVASMRLKLIRDGMEDYEYLAALNKAGESKLVDEVLRSFITNAYTFSDDPAALQSAREKLGAALHRIGNGQQPAR